MSCIRRRVHRHCREQRFAEQSFADGLLNTIGLFVGKTGVGCAELQVGNEAVVSPLTALADDKAAFLNGNRPKPSDAPAILLANRHRLHTRLFHS